MTTSRPSCRPNGGTRPRYPLQTSLPGFARWPWTGRPTAINGLQIRDYLDTEHGVKVATTGHKYPVDPAAIRDAITRRDATRDPASNPADDSGGRS